MKSKYPFILFSTWVLVLSICTTAVASSTRELLDKSVAIQDDLATEVNLSKPISRIGNVVELNVEFATSTIVKYTYRTGGINLSRGLTELTVTFVADDGSRYFTKKIIDSFYDNGVFLHFEDLPPKKATFSKIVITGKNLPQIDQIHWIDETTYSNDAPSHKVALQAPIVIEGKVLNSNGCDKYCAYTVQVTKIIGNSLSIDLGSEINVSRLNSLEQPELGRGYILELDLYNPAHPEYGYKLLGFKVNESDFQAAKALVPPGAKIVQAFPVEERNNNNWENFPATHASDRTDCVIYRDLDGDGTDELVIIYSSPTLSEYSVSLNIYKKAFNAWELQYHHDLGSVVFEFGVLRLLGSTPRKQLLISTGEGASVGYWELLIQYQEGKYKSLFSKNDESPGNWGIAVGDFDGDGNKEILAYQRYWPFPEIYSWNPKNELYEIVTDTNSVILKKLYSASIRSIKTPYGSDGEFSDLNAWKLFIDYDKLGDYENAIKIGNELLEFQRKNKGEYGWLDQVKSRLKAIDVIQRQRK